MGLLWMLATVLFSIPLAAPTHAQSTVPATASAETAASAAAQAEDVTRAARAAPEPEAVAALTELIERISGQPLYRSNSAKLLIDGPETYRAMLDAIAAAEHHVHLETYIFTDDEVGRQFADALSAKAREGVQVRVIYDSVGSRSAEDDFFADLAGAGVSLHEFNPLDPLEDDGAPATDMDTRNHRKLMVVDGAVAFTGGLNIDAVYARSSRAAQRVSASGRTGWRDTHIEIRGPAVEGFQRLFVNLWQSLDEEPIAEDALPRAPDRAGDALVRVLGAVGGNDEVSPIRIAYQAAIEMARRRVLITQSYFAPDDDFVDTIVDAAARGVDVRVLVAGISDSSLLLNASRSFYSTLLDAGVRVHESQEEIMHAKTAVVDGVWSTIGSSNLDSLSFVHNHEINAVVVDSSFGASLESLFDVDVEHSVEIDAAEWAKRSLWQRAKEWWSLLFRERL
jgi:cardiolipin synthase A/B